MHIELCCGIKYLKKGSRTRDKCTPEQGPELLKVYVFIQTCHVMFLRLLGSVSKTQCVMEAVPLLKKHPKKH